MVLAAMRPFFRYSWSRDAYVLRRIGHRRGPVLVTAEAEAAGADRHRRFAKSETSAEDRVAP